MRTRTLAVAVAWTLAAVAPAVAGAAELASISGAGPHQLLMRLFTLDRAQDVHIAGTTLDERSHWTAARIWLLDGFSRRVVWDAADTRLTHRRHGLGDFDESVHLTAGDYELYLATFNGWGSDWNLDPGDVLDLILRSLDRRGGEGRLARVEARVLGEGAPHGNDPAAVRERLSRGAVVALVGVADDADERAGFAVSDATDVRIACVGEARRDGTYDAGWIEDVDSGRTVWRFTHAESRPAGGARKNRVVDEVIHLPAGRYVAHYASDDSHSFPEFNAPPPDDPVAWGLVVRSARASDAALIKPFVPGGARPRDVIVELTKVRDDEHREAGFELSRPTEIRIIAVGEGARGRMHDYGWIVDARTHETVWEMDYDRTEPAGGARKNRSCEEVVRLPAGRYVVHYASDDSHAYGDWNAAPPRDPDNWGITVRLAGRVPAEAAP